MKVFLICTLSVVTWGVIAHAEGMNYNPDPFSNYPPGTNPNQQMKPPQGMNPNQGMPYPPGVNPNQRNMPPQGQHPNQGINNPGMNQPYPHQQMPQGMPFPQQRPPITNGQPGRPMPGVHIIRERGGGILGVLIGRQRYELVQTAMGMMWRLSRRGGVRGLFAGGLEESYSAGPNGSVQSKERFGGAQSLFFGRTFEQITNYF